MYFSQTVTQQTNRSVSLVHSNGNTTIETTDAAIRATNITITENTSEITNSTSTEQISESTSEGTSTVSTEQRTDATCEDKSIASTVKKSKLQVMLLVKLQMNLPMKLKTLH